MSEQAGNELNPDDLTIVDLVCQMDRALDYQAALKALQEAAGMLGCGFVKDGGSGDTMLPQVRECFAAALAEHHVQSHFPKATRYNAGSRVRDLRESGWAEARLNRMLAALDAYEYVFRIGETASLRELVRFVDMLASPENDPANYPPPIPEPPPSIKLHT